YFAGSVGGAPLSMVKQYIEQQSRPDQGRSRAPRYPSSH
ncbi:MAG: IS200/IS605 family transposase, partial [Halomonas sp.]|nr:IS200/IS605 family transposase [Halomonas sp.]